MSGNEVARRRRAEAAQQDGSATEAFLVFQVGGQRVGFPLGDVQEIRPWRGATRVPRTVPAVLGVVPLRGTVITVCDLRMVLSLEVTPPTKKTRLLLLRTVHESMGFMVDEVLQVVRFPREDIERDVGVDFPVAILGVGRTRLSHRFGTSRRDVALSDAMEMVVLLSPSAVVHTLTSDPTS